MLGQLLQPLRLELEVNSIFSSWRFPVSFIPPFQSRGVYERLHISSSVENLSFDPIPHSLWYPGEPDETGNKGRVADQNDQIIYPKDAKMDVLLSDRDGGTGKKKKGPSKNFNPVTQDDILQAIGTTSMQVNVLSNDTDKNGDALVVGAVNGLNEAVGVAITLGSGIDVVLTIDGNLSFKPNDLTSALAPGDTIFDQLTYEVSDGRGGTSTGMVSISITGSEYPGGPETKPVAVDDFFATTEGASFAGNLISNDTDSLGQGLRVVSLNDNEDSIGNTYTLASGSVISIGEDGQFFYKPSPDFDALQFGESVVESFSYVVAGTDGQRDEGLVEVTVAGVNDSSDPTDPSGEPVEIPYYVSGLLLSDQNRWNYPDATGTGVEVNFTFLTDVPDYYGAEHWARDAFRAFTDQQMSATREALADITSYADITFSEVGDASLAAITFGLAEGPFGGGAAYAPYGNGKNSSAGDVWIDSSYAGNEFLRGGAPYKTLIHEIGHAIGLDHPEDFPAEENNRKFTVMSYNQNPDAYALGEAQTHMIYDIAAVQHLYGVNDSSTAGDNVFGYSDLFGKIKTVWDAGGTDTIDLSNTTHDVTIDLRPGNFSTIGPGGKNNIAIAVGTEIENVRSGVGNDVLVGNDLDNKFFGGSGSDIFIFSDNFGSDLIIDFESGVDTLDLSSTGATIDEIGITSIESGTLLTLGENNVVLADLYEIQQSDLIFGIS